MSSSSSSISSLSSIHSEAAGKPIPGVRDTISPGELDNLMGKSSTDLFLKNLFFSEIFKISFFVKMLLIHLYLSFCENQNVRFQASCQGRNITWMKL